MTADLPGRKRVLYALTLLLLCLLVLALVYLTTAWGRGAQFYGQIKQGAAAGSRNGYRGDLLQYDASLGYASKPGGSGRWLIAYGDPVPAYIDADGLRVPSPEAAADGERRPRLLFLGDSFTYGQLVAAENAFAWKAAAKLGGTALNAGVPGYNLAQMTLRARQLVPKLKPDYVVVQYSPWLAERALTEFAPSVYPTHVSVPYYANSDAGLAIQPPLFRPAIFSLPEKYWQSAPGFADRFSFITTVALPALLWDDSNMLWLRSKQLLGLAKRPATDQEAVIRKAYDDINNVARENGARLIIAVLGFGEEFPVPGQLFPRDIYGVNTQIALMQPLQDKSRDSYVRHYWLWRGNPPQPVDAHPNEQAHEIIAQTLAQRVRMAPALP